MSLALSQFHLQSDTEPNDKSGSSVTCCEQRFPCNISEKTETPGSLAK